MRCRRLGLIYRLVQLGLLVYLIGYVFMSQKSYQKSEKADSSVVTKIKGILRRNTTNFTEIWDSSDFIVPAQESDAFFIATNLLYTYNQHQGICAEDVNVGKKGIQCANDTECAAGTPTPFGNGIRTGRCVQQTGTCEISGWCPTEVDVAPEQPALFGYDSVTVLVKNHINFPKFGVKRRNILESFSQKYLQTCRFHPTKDPLCPIFSFRDMITFANEDLDLMAVKGGIIGFSIEWSCNLDNGPEECLPVYSFRRLDNTHDKVAKGWNFRHTFYHYYGKGEQRRDLVKFWGIRFVFLINGRAGKFNLVYFILHFGSSIGLFGCASVICEIILQYTGSNSELLNDSKFVNLESLKAKRRSSLAQSTLNSYLGNNSNGYPLHRSSLVQSEHRRSNNVGNMNVAVVPLEQLIRDETSGAFNESISDLQKRNENEWV